MAKRATKRAAKRETKTSSRRIKATERQAAALEMRAAGNDFRTIAKELGYRGPSGSHRAVMSALKKTLQEPADELRQLELARLDKLWRISYALSMGGNGPAIDRCIRLMERRAKLLGLDASIEYTIDDIRSIARRVVNVITTEVADEEIRERIFVALGFAD
jgi:hypothetical protein